MTSTILLICRQCGHERDLGRDEIVSGAWKRAACLACGHVRDQPSSPAARAGSDQEDP